MRFIVGSLLGMLLLLPSALSLTKLTLTTNNPIGLFYFPTSSLGESSSGNSGPSAFPVPGTYIAVPNTDYLSADIVPGSLNTCSNLACCFLQCEANPSCAMFMFGVGYGPNCGGGPCCWIKAAAAIPYAWGPSPPSPITPPGVVTTYLKLGGYTAITNTDYLSEDIIHGSWNPCSDLACCHAMCDSFTDCAIFMFGTGYGPNCGGGPCCWIKLAVAVPGPGESWTSPITPPGSVTTYLKLGGYTAIPNTDYLSADIVPGSLNACTNLACCQAQCDANPSCGIFMFGTGYGPNCGGGPCCWIKKAWASSDPTQITPPGSITTYLKAGVPPPGGPTYAGLPLFTLNWTDDGHWLGGTPTNPNVTWTIN